MCRQGPWPVLKLKHYIIALESRRDLMTMWPALFEKLVYDGPADPGLDERLEDDSWSWCPDEFEPAFLSGDPPPWDSPDKH